MSDLKGVHYVYLSYPAKKDANHNIKLLNVRNQVFERLSPKIKVVAWDKNLMYYNPDWVKYCNIFVFTHPHNAFKFEIETLPSGVRREYKEARFMNKPIFLAYKTKTKEEVEFYPVEEKIVNGSRLINGIAGRTGEIFTLIEEIKSFKGVDKSAENEEVRVHWKESGISFTLYSITSHAGKPTDNRLLFLT